MFALILHGNAFNKRFRDQLGSERAGEKWIEKHTPRPAGAVVGVLFAYMVINFLVFIVTHEGQPREREGKFGLYNHGKLVRELSEEEFHDHERYEVRGVSGHWILFTALPTGYFLFAYPRARAALACETEPDDAGDPPADGVI